MKQPGSSSNSRVHLRPSSLVMQIDMRDPLNFQLLSLIAMKHYRGGATWKATFHTLRKTEALPTRTWQQLITNAMGT